MMKLKTKNLLIIFIVVFLGMPNQTLAFRSSTNYRIWSDAVDSGGNRSSSTNFVTEDTIGEDATGEDLASVNFLADAGLPAFFEEPVLRMTISSSSLNLFPDLSSATISSASYTVSVATNSDFGYTLRAFEDGELRSGLATITDVSDGAITAGSSEYGVAVSGDDAAFINNQALSGIALTLASRNGPTTGTTTTVTHLASIASGVTGGTYSQVISLVVVANY